MAEALQRKFPDYIQWHLITCTNLDSGNVLGEGVWDNHIENNVKFAADLAKAYKDQYHGIIFL
eukprot:12800201-Ditylum_brightwellii.AAC.1